MERVELEADGEQEDGHTQVAQDVNEFEVGQGGGSEQEAGGEEADEKGQARAARAFAPQPRPSAMPVAMAMTFFTAPPTWMPIRSLLV